MTDLDISPEFQPDVPLWVRFVLLGFANALASFLLCALVLSAESAAVGVVFLFGLLTVPAVTAAVAASNSARARAFRLSAHAAVGYFALWFAFGLAIELGMIFALAEMFWNPAQLGS